MFKEKLKSDLKAIFGVNKVLFDKFTYGKEQDVIFCEIDSNTINLTVGKEYARVEGSINIAGDYDKLKYGFFHKKIEMADKNIIKNFQFERNEDILNYTVNGDKFTKYGINFIYIYRNEFNPEDRKITDIKITVG